MRYLLLLSAVALLAQEPAKTTTTPPEEPFRMSSEVGYRALTNQHGDFNTYRSVINLGEGPRLLNFQSTYKPPSSRFLDELRLNGSNWGDPLNTFALNAEKAAIYRLNLQYRNIAYFNALPSFANPQIARVGTGAFTTSQSSMDIRQRFWSVDLDLLTGRHWQPFFGIAGNSSRGRGVKPLVLDENSYPALSLNDLGYTVFRGGLRFDNDLMHVTLEQGGATFYDDSGLVNNSLNTGNRDNLYLGRRLQIGDSNRLYTVNGQHIYSSADITISPTSWLDLSAEYYFSQPKSDVRYNESALGTILWLDSLRFVNGQQSFATGYANQPRSAGGLTIEVRPTSKLRILDAWQIERAHNAGYSILTTTLDARTLSPVTLSDRFTLRQNENRLQAFYDISKKMTFFGGHRFLWGEAEVRRSQLALGSPLEKGFLERQSALGGLIYRATQRLIINADTEVGRGDQTFFRSGLQNFEQIRLRARYQLTDNLHLNARYTRLNNYNPTPGINFDFRSQQANMTVQWTPKRYSIMADYTRATILSDLGILEPVTYKLEPNRYRDNGHSGTLAADVRLLRNAMFTFGGSLFRSTGSRPTRYYQPLMRLRVPIAHNLGFLAEWRNISMGQTFYAYEGFGLQQFTVGLRLGR